jgi:DNA-binding transcriptional regulator YhcF (GntR family)
MNLFQIKIKESSNLTKVQQLVYAISEAISDGQLKEGDSLPSVNKLSSQSGFSRDTVFKAYNILKKRSIVESTPTKGYFVSTESFKVFMLLDDFSAFKEQLYRSFRENLPETYSVDLLFHHYNNGVFEQLIQNSLGRYSMFVIMNIDNKSIHPVLDKIDPNKLLILDMGHPGTKNVNFLLQDFNEADISCLTLGLAQIRKYDEIILIYSEDLTPHPIETTKAFLRFCKKNKLHGKVLKKFNPNLLKKGQVYLVIKDSELVKVIKLCQKNNYKLGSDIGVISYNDTPMKEIVEGGITVISTDFSEMGQQAAEFVKHKQKITKILPTSLILRNSL